MLFALIDRAKNELHHVDGKPFTVELTRGPRPEDFPVGTNPGSHFFTDVRIEDDTRHFKFVSDKTHERGPMVITLEGPHVYGRYPVRRKA